MPLVTLQVGLSLTNVASERSADSECVRFRTILGLLILLMGCSANPQTSKGEPQIENGPNLHPAARTGLRIDNGINRGTGYTDALGTDHNLRYIPITITNDSTNPIHLQIAFSKEYEYPIAFCDAQFNVIPMPKVWALDGGEITDRMFDELKHSVNKPSVNKTLEPGEEFVLAIGTRYPRAKNCFVLPNALFVQGDSLKFQACESRIDQGGATDPQLAVGLKLDFNRGESNESCMIIPCGQIRLLR
ncbi:MAG: hypothetical protein KJO98_05565 [Rhodothermia bacterium]|nr:hypothetical protein [Rhodothermia bacterium]